MNTYFRILYHYLVFLFIIGVFLALCIILNLIEIRIFLFCILMVYLYSYHVFYLNCIYIIHYCGKWCVYFVTSRVHDTPRPMTINSVNRIYVCGSTLSSAESSPKVALGPYVTCLSCIFAGRCQYINKQGNGYL